MRQRPADQSGIILLLWKRDGNRFWYKACSKETNGMFWNRALNLCCVLTLLAAASTDAQTVVALARHAEKVDESRDAALSEKGRERARALAALLKDAGIDAVYSTDYARTRDTAKPLSELLSKPVEIYDGDALDALAAKLRSAGRRALVVGHSDTTPELVRALGGREGSAIDPDEYDRLYLLVLLPDGTAATTVLRY
jgi:phosphohistidine phosphatase SixA